nr:unnamed protein product [Callosobruchus chinensis]
MSCKTYEKQQEVLQKYIKGVLAELEEERMNEGDDNTKECPFRQYLPNKPSKYRIKIFALADSKTFYVLNIEVYTGKQPKGPFQLNNSPGEVLKRLITPISGTGRNITMDNWFMSYPLSLDLINQHNLTVVGTVRKNKRELPQNLTNIRNREEKSSVFAFQEQITAVSYIPKKGKHVILFSTMHHDDAVEAQSGEKSKPAFHTTVLEIAEDGL